VSALPTTARIPSADSIEPTRKSPQKITSKPENPRTIPKTFPVERSVVFKNIRDNIAAKKGITANVVAVNPDVILFSAQ